MLSKWKLYSLQCWKAIKPDLSWTHLRLELLSKFSLVYFGLEALIVLAVRFVQDILVHLKLVFLAAESMSMSSCHYLQLIYHSFYCWIFDQLVLKLGRFDRYHSVLGFRFGFIFESELDDNYYMKMMLLASDSVNT